MLPQQIATADYLDILFEEKNKLYGAYPLRKEYARRLYFSLILAGMVVAAFVISFYLRKDTTTMTSAMHVSDTLINILPPVDPALPMPPPPPPPPPVKKIATSMFTTPPRIVKEANPDEVPPEIETLENNRIDAFTQVGDIDPHIEAPPIGGAEGITALPTRKDDNIPYIPVHIESSYPGGLDAWKRYLIKTLRYPSVAQEKGIKGAVTVKFIVDVDGKVSDVEAISGPEELRNEAVRVIRLSGRWTPANQNGRQVRTYKQQSIVFQLNDE